MHSQCLGCMRHYELILKVVFGALLRIKLRVFIMCLTLDTFYYMLLFVSVSAIKAFSIKYHNVSQTRLNPEFMFMSDYFIKLFFTNINA